jgi:hypothetical protein
LLPAFSVLDVTARLGQVGEVPGYNLHIMLIGLGCLIGLAAVIAIARALRARSTLNENRTMRNYLRRTTSDRNPDF